MAKSKPSKKKPAAKKGGAKKSNAKKTAKAKPAAKKRQRKTEQREVAPAVSEETTDAPAASETSEAGEETAEPALSESEAESESAAEEAESGGGGVWGDKPSGSEDVKVDEGEVEEPQGKTIVEILSSKPAPVEKKFMEGHSDALFNTIKKHFRPQTIKEIQDFIKRNSYPFHCTVHRRSENSPEVYIMLTDGTNSVRCPLNKNEFIVTA